MADSLQMHSMHRGENQNITYFDAKLCYSFLYVMILLKFISNVSTLLLLTFLFKVPQFKELHPLLFDGQQCGVAQIRILFTSKNAFQRPLLI